MNAINKTNQPNIVNGVNLDLLAEMHGAIAQNADLAQVAFRVATDWAGQTRSRSTIDGFHQGGAWVKRHFTIDVDEPVELLGTDTAPNPQELLMAALNACMIVGYVAGAALHGITLSHLSIETEGAIDVRGFMGDPAIPAGYTGLAVKVSIAGNGSAETFREIHAAVMRTSPNFFNITRPVPITAQLAIAA